MALAVLYVALALAGMKLASLPPGNLTVFWLPAGIGLAIMVATGRWGALLVFAASLVANFSMIDAPGPQAAAAALASAAVDAVQSVIAWKLLLWLERRAGTAIPGGLRQVTALLATCLIPPLLTVWALPAIHAASGTAPLSLVEYVHRVTMLVAADTTGLFLLLPLVVLVRDRGLGALPPRLLAAALALGLFQLAVSAADPLLAPLALCGLTLMAFVFLMPGAALANLVCATILVAQASQGFGPLGGQAAARTVFLLTLTIIGVGMVSLCIGMLQAGRQRMQDWLEAEVERRTAELREQARALAASNSDLENFAYVASHDLREPLRMVSSYISLLERRLGGELDEDCREFIGFARNGAKRMDRLILDLLDYSRLGRGDAPPEPADLAQAVAEAATNLKDAIAATGAELVVNGTLPIIHGIPGDLVRLFQNLIGNAVKFHHRDRPPKVEISAHHDGASWRITVTDNGIGIAPDHVERVFGIFQRLHGRHEYDGTGIGLAACKRIADHHGGSISIRPNPDYGCTVEITLP